jgi:hypothetical protein
MHAEFYENIHRSGRAWLLLGLLLAGSSQLWATELLNDGWSDGETAAFQSDFDSSEIGASRFVPAGPCPCAVTSVSLLYGGVTATRTVRLHIWEDAAITDSPGPEIFSWDFQLTGANDALQVLDVEAFGIFVNGPFRVGFEFFDDGLPSIASDTDANIQPDTNYILFAGLVWVESSVLGLTGDWIIRVTVDEQGELADELKNDAWPPSLAAHFQGGFLAGESAGIRLTPPGPCPCPINGVSVLIGGAPGFADIGLRIWDDSALTDSPGALIYSDDLELASAGAAINFIPLALEEISVDGPFRLGFEMLNGGFPAVARDDDGIHAGLNFIDDETLGWVESGTLGLLGDWIMRAAVTNQNLEVANLGFDDWDAFVLPAFQDGFVIDEIAAVRLEPNIPCPCLIRDVRLMFGGADGPASVTVHIWEDGGVLTPGPLLYSDSHMINPNLLSLRTIDLQNEGIEINGPIRVGIKFDNAGLPSVARDHDGILPGNNFIFTDGDEWVDATSESVPGDWIIRARIVPVLVFSTSFE